MASPSFMIRHTHAQRAGKVNEICIAQCTCTCVCVWMIYNVHNMYKTLTRRRRERWKERKRQTFIPLFAHFRKRGKDGIFAHFAGDFRKASLFFEKSGNPEISGHVASLQNE